MKQLCQYYPNKLASRWWVYMFTCYQEQVRSTGQDTTGSHLYQTENSQRKLQLQV